MNAELFHEDGVQTPEKAEPTILAWLCRDFATTERYKALARRFYLATVIHPAGTGDSEQARKDLAGYFSTLFAEFFPKTLNADKWTKDFASVESVTVSPAETIHEEDWDWIADYFLLAASVPWKEFEELNKRRADWNQSYTDRVSSNQERVETNNKFITLVFNKILDRYDDIDLDAIASNVRQEHFPSFKKTGEQKEDSERANMHVISFKPVPLIETEKQEAAKKFLMPEVPLYQPKYFRTNREQ